MEEEDIIGLTLDEFKELGLDYRVVQKDGINYVITCDFVMERYNLYVTNNIITKVKFG